MTMETDFRTIMAGDTELSWLVGTRIYPVNYAQSAESPAVRYGKITGVTGLHMGGSDGLSEATMQVDVRVADVLNAVRDAQTIRDRLVALLHGYSGCVDGTDFRLIELQSDRGIRFDNTGPTSYYTASLDFTVWSRAT